MSTLPPSSTSTEVDLLVVGATPAGIACAVRAARAGHRVLLTHHGLHIGGLITNALVQWDALTAHRRCPIMREIIARTMAHYVGLYGADSPQALSADYRLDRYPISMVEPHVAERIFEAMVAEEATLTLWRGWQLDAVEREGRRIAAVRFVPHLGMAARGTHTNAVPSAASADEGRLVRARVFVDAMYEGDLAALAGCASRVGREGREEYGESHAGHIMTEPFRHLEARPRVHGSAHLRPYTSRLDRIDPTSTGAADGHIQAYNCRPCLTDDPAIRLPIPKPDSYDRTEYLTYTRRYIHHGYDHLINRKGTSNSAILPGENWDYPEGNWAVRDAIQRRHEAFTLGLIWFVQHDASVDAAVREANLQWGLPADEFTDNAGVPWEMYVRETRRIVGRHVLTQHDLAPRPGFFRPRPFADSIAFTDWYMDSHSCSRDGGTFGNPPNPAFPFDGKLILTEDLSPGMVPYRSLLPQEMDNLLVPVCVSATHVAWGATRLEPIWIHLGEVAGFAASQALEGDGDVGALSVAELQRRLLAADAAIGFLNEHEGGASRPHYAERQLAACHGDWDSYALDPLP